MIKRTSLTYINKILSENPSWKILDIGCGYNANKNATTVCDIQDLSSFYKVKKFIKLNDKNLPFEDGEFDFVIASHVLEHVDDTYFFIKELERISSKGYIELPTRLGDNLVFENENDHIWWFGAVTPCWSRFGPIRFTSNDFHQARWRLLRGNASG